MKKLLRVLTPFFVALAAMLPARTALVPIGSALLFVPSYAQAAAPSISCTPSRTSGTAPLGVVLDCTGTTDADTSKPFHDLLYRHTFGDPGSGIWSNGANTNASKNVATGPIAAHVYETAGTYTITSTVTDGTNIARTTNTITVADPDTTYASTATVCFFNSSVGSGCPSGATETSSSDWDAAIASCRGTTKRCLFKRGDTFTASANSAISTAGPMTIGAYGSGALPIVSMGTTAKGILLNNAAVTDLRIMDIDILGGSAVDSNQNGISLTAAAATVTVLRVTMREVGGTTIAMAPGSNVGCTNCVVQDSDISANYSGYPVQATFYSSALLGNEITFGAGFAASRLQQVQKTVIAHNTVTGGALSQGGNMTIRAHPHSTTAEDTFYVVVSDNKYIQGTASERSLAFEGSVGGDERIYDVVVERNWIVGQSTASGNTCLFLKTIATRMTIRNNLITIGDNCASYRGIDVRKEGTSPVPTDINIYNNTLYSSVTGTINGTWLSADATNTIVKNNICWFDNGTACLNDLGSGTTAANNSTTGQTTGTDPAFDNTATPPYGFRIGTGSYAATGGTALFPSSNDDFYNCDDTTPDEHMGAFISRTRARCKSGAGP